MVLLTLILTSFFNNAFAQSSDSQTNTPRTQTINFEGAEVNGELTQPNGTRIKGDTRALFNPLVHVRKSFSEEMQNSIENL